jgi:phage shock protein C
MNSYCETTGYRLYRDADRAMLAGVCAGLAGYFGLNLRVTRILAFIAFLMAMPIAVTAYLAAVILIPAESNRGYRDIENSPICRRRRRARGAGPSRDTRRACRNEAARAESTGPTVTEIRERCRSLDKRLAELERQVTSPRFQLEQEFRKL